MSITSQTTLYIVLSNPSSSCDVDVYRTTIDAADSEGSNSALAALRTYISYHNSRDCDCDLFLEHLSVRFYPLSEPPNEHTLETVLQEWQAGRNQHSSYVHLQLTAVLSESTSAHVLLEIHCLDETMNSMCAHVLQQFAEIGMISVGPSCPLVLSSSTLRSVSPDRSLSIANT